MASTRTYGDRCGIARALDLVGERWALLIVRELLLGPKRFTDLRSGLPHLSPDVLSQRLRELESAGVVRRRKLAPPAAARVYQLTGWGRELEPAILALGRWGSRAPFPAGDAVFGPDAVILALRTLFVGASDGGVPEDGLTVELGLGEQRFAVHVRDCELEISRGEAGQPDVVLETDAGTLAELLWHGTDLRTAISNGEVALQGSRAVAQGFLALFPLPEPATG